VAGCDRAWQRAGRNCRKHDPATRLHDRCAIALHAWDYFRGTVMKLSCIIGDNKEKDPGTFVLKPVMLPK
jgi:hypothetical protein